MANQRNTDKNDRSNPDEGAAFKEHDGTMKCLHDSHMSDLKIKVLSDDSFENHNELMRAFRRLHPIVAGGPSMLYQIGMLKFSKLLRVTGINGVMGGLKLRDSAEALSALVPVRRVILPSGSQN